MSSSVRIISTLFILALVSAVCAQTPCGIVGIEGPTKIEPATPLVFKAKVAQTSKSEFNWWVSAGSITKGQGTEEIMIDTAGLAGLNVTATVHLVGVPAGCQSLASITAEIGLPPPVCGRPFDEYGDIKYRDEKARLDNFTIQLLNWPESRGLVMISAGQKTFRGEAAYRLARAKSYMSEFRGIDSSRITTLDCSFSQELRTKLIVLPDGATVPTCDVFSYSQIPLSEVRFTKPRPKFAKKFR